jgi:hypothetical protein
MKIEEGTASYPIAKANSLKVKAGLDFNDAVTNLLEQLKEVGAIRSFDSSVNYAYRACTYPKQYKANFVIETIDSKIIIVRSSKSFTNDRIKIAFYDLDGITRNVNIGKNVIASIYLVDNKEHTGFNNFRDMFSSGEYYSPATHLLYLSEFVDFLNEYKHLVEAKQAEESKELERQGLFEPGIGADLDNKILTGSDFGKAGNKLERTIADLLSKQDQLQNLKVNQANCNPIFKVIVETICKHEKIDFQSILAIQATNTVTMLRSTGSPKTDVKLYIRLVDGSTCLTTLSIKNTKASKVTCHDYKVADFIRVLDCAGTKLAVYLELFQKYPTYSSFEENMTEDSSLVEFIQLLGEKESMLSEWATMGRHDSANLISPATQISKYLFINKWDTEEYAFYYYSEYLDLIREQRTEKFGVPFAWTYPSGCKGERIQLKLPIIMR